MKYSNNFSVCITAACEIAVSLRHQFLTPEHFLLAIMQLPAWKQCTANLPDNNRIWLECGVYGYINDLEQIPEDIWEEIKAEQQHPGIPVSDKMQELFNRIELQCSASEREEADIEHAIYSLLQLEGSTACYLLNSVITDHGGFIGALTYQITNSNNSKSLTSEEITKKMMDSLEDDSKILEGNTFDHNNIEEGFDTHGWMGDGYDSSRDWHEEVVCLNDIVDQHNPLIGREKELERTIQVLCRKDKNNPLHIGEPGVGKTAIVYGLTRMIKEGRVPERLKDAKIYRMEMGGLIAGTRYRGDFEEKLKNILNGAAKEKNAILYIDEIHTMMGAGASSESNLDASNILKRYLEESDVRFIGATTFEDHKRSMGRNRAISRRFQEIEICEPSVEETARILTQLQKSYENSME